MKWTLSKSYFSDKDLERVPTTSSFVQPQDEDGGEKVESWDSKFTYILATVGYAVGLGNHNHLICTVII